MATPYSILWNTSSIEYSLTEEGVYSENTFLYIWNLDDGDTSNLFYPSHTYSNVGELIVISLQVCKDTAKHLIKRIPRGLPLG